MKIKLNGEYTKEELENKIKELDKKKTIEFKITENTGSDYSIYLYINDEDVIDMAFDENDNYSEKLHQFNQLIEIAIKEYGGKDNFATIEDINNEDLLLYGIDLYDLKHGWKRKWYSPSFKLQNNCFSKSSEVVEIILEALKPVRKYILEALGIKENND